MKKRSKKEVESILRVSRGIPAGKKAQTRKINRLQKELKERE